MQTLIGKEVFERVNGLAKAILSDDPINIFKQALTDDLTWLDKTIKKGVQTETSTMLNEQRDWVDTMLQVIEHSHFKVKDPKHLTVWIKTLGDLVPKTLEEFRHKRAKTGLFGHPVDTPAPPYNSVHMIKRRGRDCLVDLETENLLSDDEIVEFISDSCGSFSESSICESELGTDKNTDEEVSIGQRSITDEDEDDESDYEHEGLWLKDPKRN